MFRNNRHAISNLEQALETYKARNKVYGNNYKRFGAIMDALYPKGVVLQNEHQWNRFGIIIQMISKLSRYVTDPMSGHLDSIHDLGVYCFMLEELDAEQAGLDIKSPVNLVTVVDPKQVLPNPCEHVYKFPCERWNAALRCKTKLVGPASDDAMLVDHSCGKMSCINCGAEPELEQ